MATDNAFRVVSIAIWVAVIWRGVLARGLSELWWSCVLLAVITTLRIGSNVAWFDAVTGHIWLSVLVSNLAAVAAATLVVRWQTKVSYFAEAPRAHQQVLLAAMTTTMAVLVATWFAAPLATAPAAEETWIPQSVLSDPFMAVHWLVYYLFLFAVMVVFTIAAGREVRALHRGELRFSLQMLIAAAACLLIWATVGIGMQIGDLFGSTSPLQMMSAANILLMVFFVLFLAGISLPLLRRDRRRREPGMVAQEVARLWWWISGHTDDDIEGPFVAEPDDLFPRLVEIRDRMWILQQWVPRQQFDAATHLARRLGLTGAGGRAFTAAVCLELGMSAAREDLARAIEPADLSKLGGGRSQVQEAQWLARISRARRAHDTEAAAVKILLHFPTVAVEG